MSAQRKDSETTAPVLTLAMRSRLAADVEAAFDYPRKAELIVELDRITRRLLEQDSLELGTVNQGRKRLGLEPIDFWGER